MVCSAYLESHLQLIYFSISEESGFGQIATFIFYIVAASITIAKSFNKKVFAELNIRELVYLLFGLVLLFIALEEISYGQHLFLFKSPEFFKKHNMQSEFNLHNFFSWRKLLGHNIQPLLGTVFLVVIFIHHYFSDDKSKNALKLTSPLWLLSIIMFISELNISFIKYYNYSELTELVVSYYIMTLTFYRTSENTKAYIIIIFSIILVSLSFSKNHYERYIIHKLAYKNFREDRTPHSLKRLNNISGVIRKNDFFHFRFLKKKGHRLVKRDKEYAKKLSRSERLVRLYIAAVYFNIDANKENERSTYLKIIQKINNQSSYPENLLKAIALHSLNLQEELKNQLQFLSKKSESLPSDEKQKRWLEILNGISRYRHVTPGDMFFYIKNYLFIEVEKEINLYTFR